MPFEIVRNDITNMQVDAIVNAASRKVRINPGVDMAIHKKAGPQLLKARETIGDIEVGNAAITPGFELDARYVIHAPSPVWIDGTKGEANLLLKTYYRCLLLALKMAVNPLPSRFSPLVTMVFPSKKRFKLLFMRSATS